jgi:hypothetical protein
MATVEMVRTSGVLEPPLSPGFKTLSWFCRLGGCYITQPPNTFLNRQAAFFLRETPAR